MTTMYSNTRTTNSMPYLILGLFGLYTIEFVFVGILPLIVERFHVSVAKAGWLMSLFAFMVAICGPFLVLIASRYNRKTILVTALAGFTLCSILSAYTTSFSTLLALRVIPALLHPVFFSAAFATAVMIYPKERAAQATSHALIGITLGMVIGVPMTTWIATTFAYEWSLLFCALLTFIAGLGIMLKLPRQSTDTPLSFKQQLCILRKLSLWLNLVATICVFGTMFSVYSYAAQYLKTQAGMSGQAISGLLVIFGIGGVVGNLLAGPLLQKHLAKTVFLQPVLLALVYIVLYVFSSAAIMPMACITILWGAMHTSGLATTQVWVKSAAPEAPEFVTSLFVSAANTGVVLGAASGGIFINAYGTQGMMWSGVLFAMLAALFVVIKVMLYGEQAQRPTK